MAKLYRLNEDKVAETKFGVQASLIVKALEDKQPDTVKGVADRIKDVLTTRQSPERVVNFYLSTWRKKGLVSVVGDAEEIPVSNGNSSSDAEPGDTADDTPQGAPALDLVKCSNKEAVLYMVDKLGNTDAQSIAQELQVAGRSIDAKQVSDALRKLVKSADVIRNDDGTYALNDE
jgi:hypothetical protein